MQHPQFQRSWYSIEIGNKSERKLHNIAKNIDLPATKQVSSVSLSISEKTELRQVFDVYAQYWYMAFLSLKLQL